MKRFWTILCLSILILSSMIFIGCVNDQPTEPADKKLITLPAPTEVTSEGRMLSWKAVHHASEYIIKINDNEYHASETSYDLSSLTDPGTYEIKVKAVGDDTKYSDSEWASYTYTVYKILETGTDELRPITL